MAAADVSVNASAYRPAATTQLCRTDKDQPIKHYWLIPLKEIFCCAMMSTPEHRLPE